MSERRRHLEAFVGSAALGFLALGGIRLAYDYTDLIHGSVHGPLGGVSVWIVALICVLGLPILFGFIIGNRWRLETLAPAFWGGIVGPAGLFAVLGLVIVVRYSESVLVVVVMFATGLVIGFVYGGLLALGAGFARARRRGKNEVPRAEAQLKLDPK